MRIFVRRCSVFAAGCIALLGVGDAAHGQRLPQPRRMDGAPVPVLAPAPAFARSEAERTPITYRRDGTPRLVAGGLLGGAAGVLVGGLAGAAIGGNHCGDEGNPDTCYGLEGALIGAAAGYTVGVPLGTHLANHRRGSLARSLLASTAVAGAGVAVLAASGVHWNGPTSSTGRKVVPVALVAVPVVQIISSVHIERRIPRD